MTVNAPFDTALLDTLMEQAGLDLLLVTSKHNVGYMLGGHRAMFFDYMDAMGVSRYLPVVVYPRGAASKAVYVGHRTETNQRENKPFWMETVRTDSWGSVDAIEKAVETIHSHGFASGRIGVESSFLPFDSAQELARLLPSSTLVDSLALLERLRLRKSGGELAMLRTATERVIEAMEETFMACRPGMTKRDVVQILREAETKRGLTFEYCLIAAGTSMNRAPSDQVLASGDVINLDSGANFHGYLGDIARMGIVGEPDTELKDLLGMIETVQQAAFHAVRPGAPGGDIYAAARTAMAGFPLGSTLHFVAHGMGLVSHEAPHLTKAGPVPYSDEDATLPLQEGTVLSIETTLRHTERGFIKLEDTVAVTATGYEVFGDVMRGWTSTGPARPATMAA